MRNNYTSSNDLYAKIHSTLVKSSSNIYSELDELFRIIDSYDDSFSLMSFVAMMTIDDEKRCYDIIKYALSNYSFFVYDEIDIPAIIAIFNDEKIKYLLLDLLVFNNEYLHEIGISAVAGASLIKCFTNPNTKLSIAEELIGNDFITVDSANVSDIIASIDDFKRIDLIKFLIDIDHDNSIFDSYVLTSVFLSCKGPYFMNIFKLLLEKYDISSFTDEKKFFDQLLNSFDPDIIFDILDYYFSVKHTNEEDFDRAFSLIEYTIEYYAHIYDDENNDYPNNVSNMKRLIQIYSIKYNLNRDHLEYFIKTFTARSFTYLENANVRNIINLDDSKFYKIINLIDSALLDDDTLNSLANSTLQYKFSLEGKYNNLFEKMIALMSDKDDFDEFKAQFLFVIRYINVIPILAKYDYTIDSYLEAVRLGKNNVKNALHEITDAFIAKKREDYFNENVTEFYDSLNLMIRLKKTPFKKLFISANSVNSIISVANEIPANFLDSSMQELLNNETLLRKIINLKKGRVTLKTFTDDEKKYFRTFENLLTLIYDNDLYRRLLFNYNDINYHIESSDYEHYAIDTPKSYLLDIISLLDIDAICRYLDSPDYNKLEGLFNKYKLINASIAFAPICDEIDLLFDSNSIASIINFFPEILADVKDYQKLTFTSLFAYGNLYSSSSNKYKLILGDSDYNHIVMNAGSYKAPLTKCVRLDRAISLLKEMYKKKRVSIPSFIKEYKCDLNSIKAVVGNATSTINLTLGERTEACLRIGGICNDLHKFALTKPDGFNVCFYDNDNNLISRVTGIRYGNTVVFNQLRNSLNDNFSPNDLYIALKGVCDDLIKMSADSSEPIENIIITKDIALHNFSNPSSNSTYIYDPGLVNYCNSLGIYLCECDLLLLSGDSLKPVHSYVTTTSYKAVDSSVQEYTYDAANKKACQMHAINDLLMGTELKNIIPIKTNYKQLFATDTFYVGLDSNDNIVSFVLDEFKNDIDVLNKMNEIINKFNKKVKNR